MAPAHLKTLPGYEPLFGRPGCQSRVARLRNAAWHVATFEAQERLLRRTEPSGVRAESRSRLFPDGFRLLQDPWKASPDLSELRTPQAARVQAFDELLPGTREMFHNPLWTALNPRLSLADGRRQLHRMGGSLESDVQRWDRGDVSGSERFIVKGQALTLEVLRLRISLTEKDGKSFYPALKVLESLCYMALARNYRAILESLAGLVEEFLLRGVHGGEYQFQARPRDSIRLVMGYFVDRTVAIERLAGLPLGSSDEICWQGRLDMSGRLIDALVHSYRPEGVHRLEWLFSSGGGKPKSIDIEKLSLFETRRQIA